MFWVIFRTYYKSSLMRHKLIIFLLLLSGYISCNRTPSAQELVDRAIQVSGGDDRYTSHTFEFFFRDRMYRLTRENGERILWRHTFTDSGEIRDKMTRNGLKRYMDGQQIALADSMARKYANSVNSVHYFAYLPYGLNDNAVQKKRLGRSSIHGIGYDIVQISFQEAGGGEDFEDVFLYWFNEETGKPDYLAYEYHTEGGGTRFRAAQSERYVKGIRFVDYRNYKPVEKGVPLIRLDSLYEAGALQLLSEIKLDSIRVIPGNYN